MFLFVTDISANELLFPRCNARSGYLFIQAEPGKFTVAIFGRERRTGSKRRQKRVEEPGGVSQRSRGKI